MNISGKKNQAKINALDIFVIFLVLCLIFTLAYRIYKGAAQSRENDKASFVLSFDCEESIDSIMRYVKDGDSVYISSSGELLGYIVKRNDGQYALYERDTHAEETQTEQTTASPEYTYESGSGNINNALEDGYGPFPDQMKEDESIYRMVKLSGSIDLNGNIRKSVNGNYYVLGGENITVGGRLTVHTDNTEFVITITEISEKNR